jgi:uncharacterized protein YwqG
MNDWRRNTSEERQPGAGKVTVPLVLMLGLGVAMAQLWSTSGSTTGTTDGSTHGPAAPAEESAPTTTPDDPVYVEPEAEAFNDLYREMVLRDLSHYHDSIRDQLDQLGEPDPDDGDMAYRNFIASIELPSTRAEVEHLLTTGTELSADRVNELVELAIPAAGLFESGLRDDAIDGGRSQVGGYPLLPREYRWPIKDGVPLTLVAQIDLDAIPDFDPWPESGLIQFYLPLTEWLFPRTADGYPLTEGRGPIVLWFEDTTGFVQRSDGVAPLGDEPIPLDVVPFLSLPDVYGTVELQSWSEAELEAYTSYPASTSTWDQFGGWSSEWQDDPRREATRTDVTQWVSLLELSLMPGDWGESGQVRWVIERDRAAIGDFTNTYWDWVVD